MGSIRFRAATGGSGFRKLTLLFLDELLAIGFFALAAPAGRGARGHQIARKQSPESELPLAVGWPVEAVGRQPGGPS